MSFLIRSATNALVIVVAFVAPAEAFAGTTTTYTYTKTTHTTYTSLRIPAAPVEAPCAEPCVRPVASTNCFGGNCYRPCRQVSRTRIRRGGRSIKTVFRGRCGRRCF